MKMICHSEISLGRNLRGRKMTKKLTIWLILAIFVAPTVVAQDAYTPPPESAGGWRRCKTPEEVRSLGGMDPEQLGILREAQLALFAGPWQIVIIHHGYLVAEWYGLPAMPTTTFDGWSSTKSATGIAYGLLMEDSRNHKLPDRKSTRLNSSHERRSRMPSSA